jgi:hypothetical protein
MPGRVLSVRRPCSTLGFSGPFSILAQADFEEDERDRRDQPQRNQHEREQLPDKSRYQDGTQRSGDHQDPG